MVLGIVDYNSHEAPRVGVVASWRAAPAVLELGGDGGVFLFVGRRGTSRLLRVWFQM